MLIHMNIVDVIMLGTSLKPPARFKAVWPVSKPSGRLRSRRSDNLRFQSRLAGRLRNGPRTVYARTVAPSNLERPSFRALTCVKKLGRFASYGEV